jgi:uncharacterized protein DUF6599
MRRALATVALLLFASFPAAAQGILPISFAEWRAETGSQTISDFSTAEMGAALHEYGLTGTEMRLYELRGDTVLASLYRFKDPSGAYGAYSYMRAPEMSRAGATEHSSMAPGRALILEGNLLADVSWKGDPPSHADLKALAASLASRAEQGPYPTIGLRLPQEGMIPRTDRYILGPATLHQLLPAGDGDWLGFSEGAEAELARYRVGNEVVTLLVADFPTPQAAAKKLDEIGRRFSLDGSPQNGDGPRLFARRSLTLVALVANARSQAVADSLLGKIDSGAELTWNEPTFSLRDPSVVQMLAGVFVGTGIICAFTLVAALAFGGVRLAVKRIFPDRVFDRSSSLQVLQLGLSSKPIEAKDFYSFRS